MRLGLAALTLVTLLAVAGTTRAASGDAAIQTRIDRLRAEVSAGEDIRSIKKLQRAYSYYVDKGMWEDVAALFTEDAVGNYPAGTFVGKDSLRQHLYMNVGGGKMGDIGLGDGRLYDHMNIQPVVHLDPGGATAKGRWRAFAMFGSFGGGATWAEGVYEMGYAKIDGVWRIRTLDYYSGFGAPFDTGWAPPAQPQSGTTFRKLAHAPDRERNRECDGFAAACVAPFHYPNPGTNDGAHVWAVSDDPPTAEASRGAADARQQLASLRHRVTLLQDEQQIENLQRIYGYYLDRAMWDQVADLFASDGSIEFDQRGVYLGKQRVRRFLDLLGPNGLRTGWLNDHLQLQIIVDVAADGRSARARSRELDLLGTYGGHGTWSEGTYENSFVKEHGVWKFKALHYFPTFITDAGKGWAKNAEEAPGVSATLRPDEPPSEVYEIFPKAYVPAFHYVNPVSGEPPHYPSVGAPSAAAAVAIRQPLTTGGALERVNDVKKVLAGVEHDIARVKDYDELENLESAYGYYLDKNRWNDLADLFSADGSMELAQRGVYRGRERVRAFLLTVFGRGQEGPVAGHLGNHIQIQPVITVADDGQSARIRSRVLQQMNFGPRASLGGGVYENVAVKEEGRWKLKVDHVYNTFTASYEGNWALGANRYMPGPSADFPPDAPPTFTFAMYPSVYDIPIHYANPVTGNARVPPLGTGVMPAEIDSALREIGARVEGQRTTALYVRLQGKEPYQGVSVARDISYGPFARNVLDVFQNAKGSVPPSPVVVFIHGGGFTVGSKRAPGSPFFDNIGVWAVAHGLVGVTINYRLAPESVFPSGIEDLTALVAWLQAHAAEHGGDPRRIYLWGHSAGAAHVADFLAHAVRTGTMPAIAGAILTSGFYDLGNSVSIWKAYYGEDLATYADRSSLPWLLQTPVPLLVTNAELDPESFRAQTEELRAGLAKTGKAQHNVFLRGASHVSETYAVGSGDESLSAPVLEFIRAED